MDSLLTRWEDGKAVKGSLQGAMQLDGEDDKFGFLMVSPRGKLSDLYLIGLQRVFKEAATQHLDKTKYFMDQREASVDFYILEVSYRALVSFYRY